MHRMERPCYSRQEEAQVEIKEFESFHTSDKYLPPGSDVLLFGTGSSVVYNSIAVLDYIEKVRPIIIGINGYLHGILSLAGKDLRKEVYRSDADMSKVCECITADVVDMLRPHIVFSNYLLQGEKHFPDGKRKDKKLRGPRGSKIIQEPLKDNLFHVNVASHRDYMERNGVYVNCPHRVMNDKKELTYYGEFDKWKYHRYKKFHLYPPRTHSRKKFLFIDEYLKDIQSPSLDNLYGDDGISFWPMHGGEYYLSWLHYNQIRSLAISGLNDRYKCRSKKLTRNWFWCKPKRILPKNMLRTQSFIIERYKLEYGERFVDLNLHEEK